MIPTPIDSAQVISKNHSQLVPPRERPASKHDGKAGFLLEPLPCKTLSRKKSHAEYFAGEELLF